MSSSNLSKGARATVLSSAAILLLNFVTGLLVARALNADGRGQVGVLMTWVQTVGWLVVFGFNDAATYLIATRPSDSKKVVGSTAIFDVLAGLLGVAILALVFPFVLKLSPNLLPIARIYALTVFLVIANEGVKALVAGNQDFGYLSFIRFAQPALYATMLIVLFVTHRLTVTSTLVVASVATLIVVAHAIYRTLTTIGIGKYSSPLVREGWAYGLRLQGGKIGELMNGRLDVLILPTVVATYQIGYYMIAVSVSVIIVQLLGSIGQLVFPAAARLGPEEGVQLTRKALRVVFFGGLLVSVPLYFGADVLLRVVYGPGFAGSVLPLRILLPGAIALACTGILSAGFKALGRAAFVSWAQLGGLVVTAAGLWLFLPRYGILAASAVSTVSYTLCFLAMLIVFVREHGQFSELFSVRIFMTDVRRHLGRRVVLETGG